MSLFDSLVNDAVEKIEPVVEALESLPLEERIKALNRIRQRLHEASPFDDPVDCVQWLPADDVEGNDYNPNEVPPPEMRLLKLSIDKDGYTQPIVAWRNNGTARVVDGEHRTRIGKDYKYMRKRLHNRLPVTFIKPGREGRNDRIAATIRHNRARGVHSVLPMTDIVAELIRCGWTDDEVAKELGMDADEVLRFKQNKGLPELFRDHDYNKAWE